MENAKLCHLIFAFAVMSSCVMVTWCQSCGTKAFGGKKNPAKKLGYPFLRSLFNTET